MIGHALAHYLRHPQNYGGPAATPFEQPVRVDQYLCRHRDDARRHLQSFVGPHIYASRRPTDAKKATAITLRQITTNRDYGLSNEDEFADSLIQCDIYGFSGDAATRVDICTQLLEIATSSYQGDWNGTYVDTVEIANVVESAIPPADADKRWGFVKTVDLRIIHDHVTARYPAVTLRTVITFTRAGDLIKASVGKTVVPPGLSIDTVAWTVYDENDNAVVVVDGTPGSILGTAGVSGTPRNPIFDLVTLGQSGKTVSITAVVTDTAGNESAAVVTA